MKKKNSFKFEELIDCANGKLFGPGNAKLPSPPMLMFDRISNIEDKKGLFNKGLIEAELDIKEKMWFFDCHFKEDPVMPGCLGLDAMWQLVGFFLGWIGEPGKGRALGVNNVKFIIIPALALFIPVSLVLKQPDLGTATLIALSGIFVVWMAGFRIKYFIYTSLTLICLAPVVISFLNCASVPGIISCIIPLHFSSWIKFS